jgi:putative ABC transport system substrate-binding protein
MRRRDVLAAIGVPVLASPIAALAQQRKPAVIGFLHPGSDPTVSVRVQQLAEGIREKGYAENRDFVWLIRWADFKSERLGALAAELASNQVTVLVAAARAAEEAARSATTVIPIVALDLETDPVAAGLVASLARPGGNLTGIFFDFPEISAKWLQLLGEALPGLRRLAILYDPAVGVLQMTAIKAAAAPLGIELQMLEVNGPADMAASFDAAQRNGAQAIMALSSPIFGGNAERLADLAITHRIPGLSLFPEFARAGGLMAYGPDIADLYRQVGGIVGKVLDGRPPADLPIERPARIRLAINLKTATALGVTIPLPLLARADEVIE